MKSFSGVSFPYGLSSMAFEAKGQKRWWDADGDCGSINTSLTPIKNTYSLITKSNVKAWIVSWIKQSKNPLTFYPAFFVEKQLVLSCKTNLSNLDKSYQWRKKHVEKFKSLHICTVLKFLYWLGYVYIQLCVSTTIREIFLLSMAPRLLIFN